MTRRFGLTFDYLCPFARNANEYAIAAIRDGADIDVTWMPYSLAQNHVDEDEPSIWDREQPDRAAGILALQAGLAARDHVPHRFLEVHEQLFAARHDHGQDLKEPEVVRAALSRAGADPDEVLAHVEDGSALKILRHEHDAARSREVWGVPTFVTDERAVFVRVLDRPNGDAAAARRRIDAVLDLVDGDLKLHEFKQVDLPV